MKCRGTDKRTGPRPARYHPYLKTIGPARPKPVNLDCPQNCWLFLEFLTAFKQENADKPLRLSLGEGIDKWVGLDIKSRKLYVRTAKRNKQRKMQNCEPASRPARKFPKMKKACNTKKGKGKRKRAKPKAQLSVCRTSKKNKPCKTRKRTPGACAPRKLHKMQTRNMKAQKRSQKC